MDSATRIAKIKELLSQEPCVTTVPNPNVTYASVYDLLEDIGVYGEVEWEPMEEEQQFTESSTEFYPSG